jgi:hypothetical protein
MTFKRLPDGAREITHPSGVKVIETREQRLQCRADLIQRIAEMTKELAAADVEEKAIAANAEEKAIAADVEEKLNG